MKRLKEYDGGSTETSSYLSIYLVVGTDEQNDLDTNDE